MSDVRTRWSVVCEYDGLNIGRRLDEAVAVPTYGTVAA